MVHLSENSARLAVREIAVHDRSALLAEISRCTDVCLLRLPADRAGRGCTLDGIGPLIAESAGLIGPQATLVIVGDVIELVQVHAVLASSWRYHLWLGIKRATVAYSPDHSALPQQHFGTLIYSRSGSSLRHAKTRIAYTYCPACDKTTKDYGGKKHTYHEYGTLLSDVWRDVACDLDGDLTPIVERFADLFGVEPYRDLHVLDLRPLGLSELPAGESKPVTIEENNLPPDRLNTLITGDCLAELRTLPDNSVDFAFADPPYNLGKDYTGYADDLAITEYFAWCDQWIAELARVLRPGRTVAVLNIPLWAIRHFLYMQTVLEFQNWIAWDALSFPVRMIMPAHYAIVCFSKGPARPLPGLIDQSGQTESDYTSRTFRSLAPLAEGFCLRAACVDSRLARGIDDRGPLTDLWWDIHRIKHNSRRVDHPCQLPPQLMYRLISVFTRPGEIVLDCFNGAGTTTLAAHQLGRAYLGIEASETYNDMARERHAEVDAGIDPFRKVDRVLTAKNSPVARLPKQKYAVSKKALQLEVKRVAEQLGRLPTREELITHGKYPIAYYDAYFSSWGEVCAAARTTGMSETRETPAIDRAGQEQLRLFE
jgi:DNA modification methylase